MKMGKTIEQRVSELEADQKTLIGLLEQIFGHYHKTHLAYHQIFRDLTNASMMLVESMKRQVEFSKSSGQSLKTTLDAAMKIHGRLLPLEHAAATKRPKATPKPKQIVDHARR